MLQFYGDYIVAAPYVITQTDLLAIQPGLRVFKLGETDSPQDLLVRPISIPLRTPRQETHKGFYGWLMSYANF
jgi:hypothetical protein